MRTDINFFFTSRTAQQLIDEGHSNISFPAPNLSYIPLAGDFFSEEEMAPHTFVVQKRTFHWKNKEHLQISLELDLYTDEDHFVRTGSLK